MTGVFAGLSRDVYDKIDAINFSTLKHVRRSPAHARHRQLNPPAQSEAQRLGTLIHCALLEPERFKVEYVELPDLTQNLKTKGGETPKVPKATTEYKQRLAEFGQAHPGRRFVEPEDMAIVRGIGESIAANVTAASAIYPEVVECEVAAVWNDPDTGLLCKALMDAWSAVSVVDVKSVDDASPGPFARLVAQNQWHGQAAWYLWGLSVLGKPARRFLHLACEVSAPFGVAVYELDDAALDQGLRTNREHLNQWAACVAAGRWDLFPDRIEPLSLPKYAFHEGRARMTTNTKTPHASQQQQVAERTNALDATVEFKPFLSEEAIKLSVNLIMKYHCRPTKSGKLCTPEQAMRFLMLCKARLLNPWEGDAFLVGFDSQDGPEFNLITAHQAFLKRAEAHPSFDGMESGVLVVRGSEVLELQGDFHNGDDVLVGGWAKVFRRDRTRPTYRRLKLATFNKGFSRWKVDPAGMIVKCAEADALRSTFPNSLAGMYMQEETDDRPPTQTPQQRVAGIKSSSAITNGNAQTLDTHTPAELVVQAEPVREPEPVRTPETRVEPTESAELTPLQYHARALEKADTEQELDAAYQAAFGDKGLSKSDKVRIGQLRDQRKAALSGQCDGKHDGPACGDPDCHVVAGELK